ncbi:MAG: DUF3795 domain-containing protein [Armatimonadota bacterium]
MDYEKMTAPCGLACFDCVIYKANDDEELRKRVSLQLGIPMEKAVCNGCREENGKCPVVISACDIFPCTREKGVKFCFECQDFPCDHLHPYADKADKYPLNVRVFNLCLIKKMGLEAWAESKAKSVKEEYFKGKLKL